MPNTSSEKRESRKEGRKKVDLHHEIFPCHVILNKCLESASSVNLANNSRARKGFTLIKKDKTKLLVKSTQSLERTPHEICSMRVGLCMGSSSFLYVGLVDRLHRVLGFGQSSFVGSSLVKSLVEDLEIVILVKV